MTVIGIDPGPRTSGVVWFDGQVVTEASEACENEALVGRLREWRVDAVIIERVQFYGRLMGADVFDTLWWSGRFWQAAKEAGSLPHRVYWNEVKRQFVEGARIDKAGQKKKITESDVRLGVIKRFGGTKAAIGTRNKPGPLGGVRSHAWSALALAVFWWDRSSSVGIVPPLGQHAPRVLEF